MLQPVGGWGRKGLHEVHVQQQHNNTVTYMYNTAGAHPNIDLLLQVRDGVLPEMDIVVE
jgi:hypothetical protein